MFELIILAICVFIIYKFFYRNKDGGEEQNQIDNNETLKKETTLREILEQRKEISLQRALTRIYEECFSRLIEEVPPLYTRNAHTCRIGVKKETDVYIEIKTIHEVLTKASHDAMKHIGLQIDKLSIDFHYHGYSVDVKW